MKEINIGSANLRVEREVARRMIIEAGLPGKFAEIDNGHYGFTETGLELLEAIERAASVLHETVKQLAALITAPESDGFQRPRPLEPEERFFAHLFAVYVASVEGSVSTVGLTEDLVRTENTFSLNDVKTLLDTPDVRQRFIEDFTKFVEFHRKSPNPSQRVTSAATLANCLQAYFLLMENTVRELAGDASLRHLRGALESTPVEILGRSFQGFHWQRSLPESSLIPVDTADIVGNEDYLKASLRVARDVAGFDFTTARNPKTFNPVLFALGRPGCGKTVTAHAVGNYFLEFCKERNVPARFLVIRRTDWASSYQNASAHKLIKIFTERVGSFEGVVGIYWPDIDTAFAARQDPGIRSEEKNILGASFGIFDGTLLERNGKWFMMCDANSMNMDGATISRITQDPFILKGAEAPEEMIRLFRDVKLKAHLPYLALEEPEWLELGKACSELALSGRSIENIARKVIAEIEDFEYPAEYFSADYDRRREPIRQGSNVLGYERLEAIVERYVRFEMESEKSAERERFDRRVNEIVFNLSAEQRALQELRGTDRDLS